MSQVKIYGLKTTLSLIQQSLSDTIQYCLVEALKIPADKRFHRFIALAQEDFYYPEDRSEAYLIIEILMMTGRSVATKKALIYLLFREISQRLSITTQNIEICILESPAYHWGFRGKTGDEVTLNYSIDL